MTLFGALIGFLPGLIWLIFYLQEPLRPEPKKLVAGVFLMGCLSALVGFGAEMVFINYAGRIGIRELSIVSIVVLAFIEEAVKFFAAYIPIHRRPEFDQPVDAMIYTMAAALGFATIENIGAVTGAPGVSEGIYTMAVTTASFRFLGATLLHSITSSLVGYYWAISIRNFKDNRFIAKGLIWATILHAVFNYIIIRFGNLIYTIAFVVIIGFFILADFERLKAEKV